MIEWLGLKFENQADLDRAQAVLGERLQRITDAERRAIVNRALERVFEQHGEALKLLGDM